MGNCVGTNSKGGPCEALEHMVRDGYCPAHGPGGNEHMRAIGLKGGQATAAKNAGEAFTAGELTPIETVEDAQARLDLIHVAVMTRRLTHAEGNAASKAISEWIKAAEAILNKRMTTETDAVIAERDAEIAALRKQLASNQRMRAAS